MQYPPNVRIIRVPCAGRVDIIYILKALENGADGVYVAGCLEGDCHYLTGNLRANNRVQYVRNLLGHIGIEKGRVEMYHMSAADCSKFVEVAKEMTERIRKLGPSPLKWRGHYSRYPLL